MYMPAARWGRTFFFSAGDVPRARLVAISEVMRMSLTMGPQFTKIVTHITRSLTPIKQDLCNLKEVASPAGDHQIFKKK
jgi:hypothetical protein